MQVASVPEPAPTSAKWTHRVRFGLGVFVVWAGLHYVINQTVLPAGLDRPRVITGFDSPFLSGLAVLLLAWLGAYVAARLTGPGRSRDGALTVAVVGFGLTLWAAGGGTMDDWLRLRVDAPRAGPGDAANVYWPLIAEYLFLLVVMLGVALLGTLAGAGAAVADAGVRRRSLRATFGFDHGAKARRDGLLTLITTAAIAAVVMWVLMGPRAAHTHHGQVYFATGAAFAIATAVARRLFGTRSAIWYWPAPFVLGIAGVVFAALSPTLPPPYEHLNIIPAIALVRPLPVEMIGAGTVATVWALTAGALREAHTGAHEPGGGPRREQ